MAAPFFSYSHSDTEVANGIYDGLRRARPQDPAWIDRRQLKIGDEWNMEIVLAIRRAEAFIVLLTPQAVSPQSYVLREIETALRFKKRILPVMIAQCEVPDVLKARQYEVIPGGGVAALLSLLGALDDVWHRVQDTLDTVRLSLAESGCSALFEPLLEDLASESGQRTSKTAPEYYDAFCDLVDRLKVDTCGAAQPDLRSLVDSILSGTYPSGEWTWREVFNNFAPTFKTALKTWQATLPITPPLATVPIVLLVMNRAEAEELQQENTLADESKELRNLVASITGHLGSKWTERYGESRHKWRPTGVSPEANTLDQLMGQPLADMHPPLRPQYVDILDVVEPRKRSQLTTLRRSGCVVVMDLLSMCHPRLLAAYRKSLLDAYSSTMLVKVSPVNPQPDLQDFTFRVRHRLDLEFDYRQKEGDQKTLPVFTDWHARMWLATQIHTAFAPRAIDMVDNEPSIRGLYRRAAP